MKLMKTLGASDAMQMAHYKLTIIIIIIIIKITNDPVYLPINKQFHCLVAMNFKLHQLNLG